MMVSSSGECLGPEEGEFDLSVVPFEEELEVCDDSLNQNELSRQVEL